MDYNAEIMRITHTAQNDPDLLGTILYGSYLYSKEFRDIDIALFCAPQLSHQAMNAKRLNYLKEAGDIFDIQIFNLLPLAVQHSVLQGKVLFETPAMYDMAYRVIREYEDFEKYIIQYKQAFLNVD